MKKALIIGAIFLAVIVAAAGGFWGGMRYQTSRMDQTRANFANARGQFEGGQFSGDLPDFSGGRLPEGQAPGLFGGGGTSGQVKSVDGNVLTISTAEDVTTVNISTSTRIEMTVTADTADLEPGMRVLVIGERDSNGEIDASQVSILSEDVASPPGTGTEP